jgi:hypothetical protein
MGMMDKLKFWKKEEEMPAEFPRAAEFAPAEQHMPGGMEQMGMPRPIPGLTEPPSEDFGQQQFNVQAPRAFAQQQAQQQFSPVTTEQQLQLISSKLDTIKAQLETVLQRLDRLERKEDLSPYQQRWRTGT